MVVKQTRIEEYNYAAFGKGGIPSDFLGFRTKLPVGSGAPDLTLTSLEAGEKVQLSDYWRKSDVVIEFGSLT